MRLNERFQFGRGEGLVNINENLTADETNIWSGIGHRLEESVQDFGFQLLVVAVLIDDGIRVQDVALDEIRGVEVVELHQLGINVLLDPGVALLVDDGDEDVASG